MDRHQIFELVQAYSNSLYPECAHECDKFTMHEQLFTDAQYTQICAVLARAVQVCTDWERCSPLSIEELLPGPLAHAPPIHAQVIALTEHLL